MVKKLLFLISIYLFFIPIALGEKNFIPIKFGIIDTLYKEDNTPCGSYKESLDAAINYAIGENSKKLATCGYKLDYVPYYIDISDIFSAHEAGKILESKGVWFIIGPRRSDLFLLTIRGLKQTPAISLMAGSWKVTQSAPPIFTMYPDMNELVKAAFKVAKNENLGNNYGIFVDATCSACKDFAEKFEQITKNKFNEKFSLDGAGETPNLSSLKILLQSNKIDFLLLPNYSKFTGYVMSVIHKISPKIKFLGSDGWGEREYSFINNYHLPTDIIGYSVRVGMPTQKLSELYRIYTLDREWNGKVIPPSLTSYSAVQLIRNMTTLLCIGKPKNKKDFFSYLSKQKKTVFRSQIEISSYKIINHEPIYFSSIKQSSKK